MGRRLKTRGISTPFLASIATTSTTDIYIQADRSGSLEAVFFSSLAALTAHDSNYITFTVTNLGQAGAGTTEMLAATDPNTTKLTGGTGLVANGVRSFTLGTVANRAVVEGDTLRIRATATGTLAGAVTVPRVTVLIAANGA